MITLENVNKYFNKGKRNSIHVINNTSLTLEDNGLVALLGPSGCGKTTLLNAIGGLDKVNKGKIFINGSKITKRFTHKSDKIRNLNIGYIFQDYHLIDKMTVFDNIALSLKINGIKDKEEIKKRVNYVLEKVGMYRYRNRYASMLSGGERQRVGIARAIVKNPSIIIADEPTGNLDSKNSIAIMNIIKAISKDRLVILVTHEKDLAEFYASRIINIKDGSVVEDYKNEHLNDLDYRMDNKIYLKDLKKNIKIKKDNLNINYYTNSEEAISLNIAVVNGNIYIETKDNLKLEIVDEDSSFELIDEHYKKISKSSVEEYDFDSKMLDNSKLKMKYSSIYNPISLITNGFKKIMNYTFIKKVLLLGFFASGMFILYSISSIFGVTNIKDENFVKSNKSYLEILSSKVNVNDYLSYESLENINYIMPGDSIVDFSLNFKNYYQTSNYSLRLSGSLTSIDTITSSDLIMGTMPTNPYEVVVDKKAVINLINSDAQSKNVGLITYKDILNKIININNMSDFKIVGLTDLKSPSIYLDKSNFINILANATKDYMIGDTGTEILDYNLVINKIILKSGSLPVNDYEVILPESYKESSPINKTIDYKVNGVKLKVVGYYHSPESMDIKLVSNNTIKYYVISTTKNISIYPKDKDLVISYFRDMDKNIVSTYDNAKKTYLASSKNTIVSSITFSLIILGISLIEIYLIIRSSFLSRIKEIGILRAIGVKKSDIYKMFLGEILAITTTASLLGFIFMYYVISQLLKLNSFANSFMLNSEVIFISLILIYVFNIFIGLLPVVHIIKKTPAQILSRYDLE